MDQEEGEDEEERGGLTGGFFDHRGDHMNHMTSSRLAYHLYPPESKNTISHHMVRISMALNALALILSVAVIVVVVTLTMSLVTTTTKQLGRISQVEHRQQERHQQQQQQHPRAGKQDSPATGNLSLMGSSSQTASKLSLDSLPPNLVLGSEGVADGQNLVNSRFTESQAFGQILALSPLFIVTSLFGMSASQKFSSTGTIVCYWITLTFTLLISIYVTSGFIEYEELFNTRDKSSPIDAISRLIVVIGTLQITSAAIVTIAKYQKKRVAVKESSFNDLTMRLDPDLIENQQQQAADPQVIQENLILIMASPAVEVRRRMNESCLDANLHQQLIHLNQQSSDQSTASSSISSSSASSSPAATASSSSSRPPSSANLTESPFLHRSLSRPHDWDRHQYHDRGENGGMGQRIVTFEEISPHRQPLLLHQHHRPHPHHPHNHQQHQRIVIRELIPAPSVTLIREKEEK